MTYPELLEKVIDGECCCCLEVNEGTGCGSCPYYCGEEDISIESNRTCRKNLEADHLRIKDLLSYYETFVKLRLNNKK